ncbi:MAG: hypothetical protein IH585_07050 [Anaerolineaceae bacterium]|nr:hypothetical protein [Anaerolineaceae bacterium]
MGLNYDYILYFERKHLWDALAGLIAITDHHEPPTVIQFPDRKLFVPLVCSPYNKNHFNYDDPEFSFATSIYFDLDTEILDYLRMIGNEDIFRGPPDPDRPDRVQIGYIYLTIYNDLSSWFLGKKSNDFVFFDFGTTGTKMSLLFDASPSIRKTFCELLESVPGLYGIFSREFEGELFWYKGQHVSKNIGKTHLLPDELEEILNEPWMRNQ